MKKIKKPETYYDFIKEADISELTKSQRKLRESWKKYDEIDAVLLKDVGKVLIVEKSRMAHDETRYHVGSFYRIVTAMFGKYGAWVPIVERCDNPLDSKLKKVYRGEVRSGEHTAYRGRAIALFDPKDVQVIDV